MDTASIIALSVLAGAFFGGGLALWLMLGEITYHRAEAWTQGWNAARELDTLEGRAEVIRHGR